MDKVHQSRLTHDNMLNIRNSSNDTNSYILCIIAGADPGFQVYGVFRVKNHDFTPKNHIFFQFQRGARAGCAPWIRPCIGLFDKDTSGKVIQLDVVYAAITGLFNFLARFIYVIRLHSKLQVTGNVMILTVLISDITVIVYRVIVMSVLLFQRDISTSYICLHRNISRPFLCLQQADTV